MNGASVGDGGDAFCALDLIDRFATSEGAAAATETPLFIGTIGADRTFSP
jgi:hypothetical protein